VAFNDTLSPPAARPPDMALPTVPPLVHDRYTAWVIGADVVSIFPLTEWMISPDKFYFAMPSLLLAPMIHAAHGEIPTAAGSLAMRGAMLGAVYLARESAEAECEGSDEIICVPFGSILLIVLAYVSVTTVDAVLLAKRTRRADGWDQLPVKPSMGMSADGRKWLSLGGSF
jgi:hypothetical protein